jgi:hypothetical protein
MPISKEERATRKNKQQALKRAWEAIDYKRLKALEANG